MLTGCRLVKQLGLVCCVCLTWAGPGIAQAGAAPPASPAPALPVVTMDQAVLWALQHNPDLAALRQQHGIAAAGIVIANTYPFNPIWEAKVRAASGPESAGITNRVSNEHKFLLDVEIRGQGKYRRQGAWATLSRTDWEIANQELTLAVRVLRAFGAVLYRQEKLRLLQQVIQVNEEAADQVRKLVEQGRLRPADLIVIRTEVADARAQVASGNTLLVPAWHELRRAMGLLEECFVPRGSLEVFFPEWDACLLTRAALEHRADLHARRAAVAEAESRVQLAVANRFGNPNVGPAYEYDPTRINLIGVQFSLPLPVLNLHRGEIMQRQEERIQAELQVRQTEVLVRQDVCAALARLQQAHDWLNTYKQTVLPGLQDSLRKLKELFLAGDPGVGVPQVIDITRKLLRARDGELDARWEVLQAQIDLAAAVGDPALVIAPTATAEQLGLCLPPTGAATAPAGGKQPPAFPPVAHRGEPPPPWRRFPGP
jgi:outer membrane protein TolC